MIMVTMLMLQSARVEDVERTHSHQVEFPVETEIYILPNGQIVIADCRLN